MKKAEENIKDYIEELKERIEELWLFQPPNLPDTFMVAKP
jgi:hypothetical protein